jgi:streptomycin 6-kinase
MEIIIPERLVASWSHSPENRDWLAQLPAVIGELQARWLLSLEAPFDGDEVSAAWVAPAIRNDGTRAILKLGLPHMEAEHEIQGLRFWNGDPTVYLLEADEQYNAMLLERCEPGSILRQLPEPEQDVIIAGMLRRLWRRPPTPYPFRPLAEMTSYWASETIEDEHKWPDPGLVREGLRVFEELSQPTSSDVLLATDLHAGNVLRAQREPWLVIDPKPFIGDPAYDATQHLLNCEDRMRTDPEGTIRRFADLLEVDSERVRLWMFARTATEAREIWNEESLTLAKMLAL